MSDNSKKETKPAKNRAAQSLGRKGGIAIRDKRGSEYLSQLAKQGWEKRRQAR